MAVYTPIPTTEPDFHQLDFIVENPTPRYITMRTDLDGITRRVFDIQRSARLAFLRAKPFFGSFGDARVYLKANGLMYYVNGNGKPLSK